jgi:membrane fusion protein, multidrug efflux system
MTSRPAKRVATGSAVTDPAAGHCRMSRRVLLVPAAFLLLLGGCDEKEQGSSRPAAQQPAPTVVVVPASRQPVTQAAEFVGRVEALEKVEIRARVTGFLRDRHFQEGQVVQERDLLFTIEREPFEADVAAKQAKVESAQAELANATYQVERGRELIRTNTIPRATLDQRVAEQGVAAAAVSGARADLGLARINLGYTEILSPIAGRVGRAVITRGNVVGPEAGVLTVVVRQDPMRVTFPVSQRQLLDLRRQYEGQGMEAVRVRVRLPDGSQYPEFGRVNFIDVRTDRTADTALVQAEIANPGNILSDGQFVGIQVEGKEQQQAVVIPQSAVQIDQAGPFVLVVGEGNKIEQRRVRLSRGPAGQSVVDSGLEPGTLVVTEGAQRARPGAVVTPRPAAGDLPAAGPIAAQAG